MKILLALLIMGSSLIAKSQDIHYLSIGDSLRFPAPKKFKIRIHKKGIFTIKDHGDSIIIVGKKMGQSRFTIGKKEIIINVLHKKIHRSLTQLQKWSKNKRGPQIHLKDGQVVLKGRLLKWNDFLDMQRYLSEKSQFSFAMDLSPRMKSKISIFFKERLKKNNLITGDWVFTPDLKLLLPLSLKKQKSAYQNLLKGFGIEVEFNKQSFTHSPLVEIKIYAAHVHKNFFREYGIQWPSTFNLSLSSKSIRLEEFQASLNSLEQRGLGQILATPSLTTEINKKAEFHSGGEIPIRTTTQFNNNVQWKSYGLFLTTTPRRNPMGHLQIAIDLRMSTLDSSRSTDGIPALQNSHLKTQVTLQYPQPIFLSGFIQKTKGESRSGLAWLSQIPIFSALVSSNQISSSKHELIFILIPRVYET